ncbi:hypothetical protein Aduo_012392 [Ancylostoma duodenale]
MTQPEFWQQKHLRCVSRNWCCPCTTLSRPPDDLRITCYATSFLAMSRPSPALFSCTPISKCNSSKDVLIARTAAATWVFDKRRSLNQLRSMRRPLILSANTETQRCRDLRTANFSRKSAQSRISTKLLSVQRYGLLQQLVQAERAR